MEKRRILIVDDTLDLGRLLRTTLKTMEPSLDVTVVPSAEEAILAAGNEFVNLLVADFRLPGMTGAELIAKVKPRTPETRFILISGMPEPKVRQEAKNVGAHFFLRKPMEISEFIAAVRDCLHLEQEPDKPAQVTASTPTGYTPATVESTERLVDILAGLRQDLSARAVLLLDGRSRVNALAGDLPDETFEKNVLPDLMGAAASALKVSRALGNPLLESVLLFHGPMYELVLAPLREFSVLVILPPGHMPSRALLTVDALLGMHGSMLNVLARMGLTGSLVPTDSRGTPSQLKGSQPPQTAPMSSTATTEFEKKLEETVKKGIKDKDPNQFWEGADPATSPGVINPNVLSYDQAKKMGLPMPEESEKKEKGKGKEKDKDGG